MQPFGKVPYKEIRERLAKNEPFDGHTMQAVRITSNAVPHENYSVYSYHTLIYREVDGVCTYWDGDFYSMTTRKHQSYVKVVKGKKILEWAS